jgi:Domain of unknown function (DUF4258)
MNVLAFEKPLTKTDAQKHIRQLAFEGKVVFAQHAKERAEERGITHMQILHCLAKGTVDANPTQGKYEGEWKTEVIGHAAGERLCVPVCITLQKNVMVITVYQI